MGVMDFLNNLKGTIDSRRRDIRAGDDKVLASLRRQRQKQLEEGEKKRLRLKIADYEKKRTSKELYGLRPGKRNAFKRKLKPSKEEFYCRGGLL